jgi:hypothetical protein
MIRISIRLILAIAATLLVIAAGFILHLFGVEGRHHCELDTPMEQAQCRAEEGR